jgi:hypothetical protein
MSEDKDWETEDENAISQDEHEEAARAARWPELEEDPKFEDKELEKEIGDMIWAILPGQDGENSSEKDT